MAAPPNNTFIEGQMLVQHSVDLQNKEKRALSAWQLLSNYNWNSTGSMPDLEWTCPNGNAFLFSSSNGEIHYKGQPYSSLNSEQKKEFFQYLPKFIKKCLDNYDHQYNL